MSRRWTGASIVSCEVRRRPRLMLAVRMAPAAIAALTLALGSALPGRAQEPSLPQVLARATEYVEELHAQLSGVVMEERYQQRASSPGFGRFGTDSYERVTLRSDYLLVQPEGSERYFGFRDVFEANGSRVRDREDRLTRLFLDGTSTRNRQVQGILTDSARYNVGDIQRNTNTPTLALLFLRQSYKPRFEFERVSDRSPSLGVDEPDRRTGVWVIAYRETWPTSVIRRRRGGNLPARGRYWVEPDTGRVLVTELVLEDDELDSLVTVRYEQPEELEQPRAGRDAGALQQPAERLARRRHRHLQPLSSLPGSRGGVGAFSQLTRRYRETRGLSSLRVRLFCVGGPEGSRRGCERHGKSYLTRRRRGEEGDGGGSLTGGAIPSA